jgi:hypothetical protein
VKRPIVAFLLLASGCIAEDESTGESTAELLGHGPRLLEAGTGITLLETTDDSYAIYQLGQQVFAVKAHHERELIADVPAGNVAFVFPVGDVAFVWTDPNRALPGFGVSPLYIWSAAGGAHLASSSSAIGTTATSANADGDRVVFTTNSPASGASGDIVLASADLGWQTTLATNVAMSFGAGPCQPRVAFRGDSNAVIGTTCPAGNTASATYSTWHHGQRTDFPQPIATPPRLRLDPDRERAVATLAGSRNPIVIDRHGNGTVIDDTAAAVSVFFAGDGAVIYTTQPVAGGPLAAFRARIGKTPEHVADLRGIYAFAFGSVGLGLPITSADGRKLPYFDAIDPNTGLGANVIVTDVRRDDPPVTLDATPPNLVFGLPFTKDSDYTLYARLDLNTFATGPMFAAGPRGNRQYSDDQGWAWEPAFGSTITFNDNTDATFTAADLKSVDLSRHTLTPRLIAAQANVTYFSSHRGRAVVYTIDTGPDAGLYVARVD